MRATEPVANTRQWLTKRQSATVDALLDATLSELREDGYDLLSIRSVAQRAGVTHTTAYSYFASKAHLVSELYWRQLEATAAPAVAPGDSLVVRVRQAFLGPTMAMDGEPALAQAVLSAIFTNDPDIRRLRDAAAGELDRRLGLALGEGVDDDLRQVLLTSYSGAMLAAGLGLQDFSTVVRHLETVARLIDRS